MKKPRCPTPRKARVSKSKVKTTLICFFDIKGIVCNEQLIKHLRFKAADSAKSTESLTGQADFAL